MGRRLLLLPLIPLASIALLYVFVVKACVPQFDPTMPSIIYNARDTEEFSARIAKRFPIGSKESLLETALRADGFRIYGGTHGAMVASRHGGFLPSTEWRVVWNASHGTITSVRAFLFTTSL